MVWNYRVIKFSDEHSELSEVYYDSLGKPSGYCSVSVIGDTPEEIQEVLDKMSEGASKPYLNISDFSC
jgi:hypothetical protein